LGGAFSFGAQGGAAIVTPVEKYLASARDAGCPPDQVERFLKAGIKPTNFFPCQVPSNL